MTQRRTICWTSSWNEDPERTGLEHLLLGDCMADGIVLGFDDERGAFRLSYRLTWDESWRVRDVQLAALSGSETKARHLHTDGDGHWRHPDGSPIEALEGCIDVDIWPTPFTNTFPIRRVPTAVGERREFRVAWIVAPDLTLRAQAQAYTRLADRRYLFENLDGTGFTAELTVDEDGIVVDYPRLFHRVLAC